MTNSATEPHRVVVRLPRPVWIGAAAVVLIVGAIAIGIGTPIYRQQAALREIHRLGGGGEVRYAGPQWLRNRLGWERTRIFEVVTVVRLGGTNIGDSDLKFLRGLGSIEHVVLYDTRVTDSALEFLGQFGQLKRLYLHGTLVTDAGIKPLTALPHLHVLDLSGTQVTDDGLAQLREIKTLRRLYIDGTQVTDDGVADLQQASPGLKIRQ